MPDRAETRRKIRLLLAAPSAQRSVAQFGNRRRSPRSFGLEGLLIVQDALFAVGLVLSVSSLARPASLPVGPGEVCLVVWLFLVLGGEVAKFGHPLTPALKRLIVFWALFAVSESLGALTGALIGDEHDPEWFLHDAMAYPLLAAVSCLSVVTPDAASRLRRVAWLVIAFGSASLFVQLMHGQRLVDIPQIDPWYWDRFRGWSAIPNQLALLCVALALLAFHLAETASRTGWRIAALSLAVLPIYVGHLTQSDAFGLALLVAGITFLVLKGRAWLLATGRGMILRSAFIRIIILALPLILLSAVPLGTLIAVQAEDLAMTIARDNGRGADEKTDQRLELWHEAIIRGIGSGMLGLGPGPHLEIPASILAGRQGGGHRPKGIEHPEPTSAPNFEAHNTILDLFVQGGLAAIFSFGWIVTAAMLAACRSRSAGLPAALVGIGLFGMFHLIIRLPIFWFVISLCLVAEAVRLPLLASGRDLHETQLR